MKEINKQNYDKKTQEINIEVNDLILIDNQSRHKLDPLFKGPYKVKSINKTNCKFVDDKEKEY